MEDPPLHNSSNGSGGGNAKLAMMLRDCADLVERNEMNPVVYQAWGALNTYVKDHGGSTATRVTKTTTTTHIPARKAASRSTSPEQRRATTANESVFSAETSEDFESGAKPFDESPVRPAKSHQHSSDEQLGSRSKDPFGFGNVAKKLGKLGGLAGHPPKPPPTDTQKSATSKKNAERAKADLADLAAQEPPAAPSTHSRHHKVSAGGGYGHEDEFCEEHFVMGCACKAHKLGSERSNDTRTTAEETFSTAPPVPKQPSTPADTIKSVPSNASSTTSVSPPHSVREAKPAFHRPTNPKSTMIATGWIEQQRRSRMRTVWKEVMVSLVEGRTPKEETTLWVQRQFTNSHGKPQLEALHQVPLKWLEAVKYLDFYTDHRFTIKVFNVSDEFQFRCSDADSAQNWVLTLRSVSEIVQKQGGSGASNKDANMQNVGLHNLDDWDGTSTVSNQTESKAGSHKMSIKELQAIAHGAGHNTAGMERSELERLVTGIALKNSNPQKDALLEEQRRRQHEEQLRRQQHEEQLRRQQQEEEQRRRQQQQEEVPPPADQPRRGVAELRSIAHGAGYNTSGMERAELERLVVKITTDDANLQQTKDAALEAQRRRQQEMAEADIRRKRQEEARRQQELAEAEQRRRQHEEEQRRLAEAEQRRRQQEEEERKRRIAEQQAAEQRKKQEDEQRRKWQQQQAAAEQQRQRLTEQQAAEQRKKQEWERAQWQQKQSAAAAAQRAEWEQKWHTQQQQQQHAGYRGQQQPPPYNNAPPAQQGYRPPPPQPRAPPPPQGAYQPPPPSQAGYRPPPPPPQPQQQHPASPADLKYAKMADQSDSGVAITRIKRTILVNWALQPPTLQILRPIDVLITTIHSVFPPACGVAGHDYFTKWTPISRNSIVTSAAMGNTPDDAKLKKAVRKLRFFLHPDKLPRDLSEEQSFMCKMLWDITSDAFEEFHKKNEELGWIHN